MVFPDNIYYISPGDLNLRPEHCEASTLQLCHPAANTGMVHPYSTDLSLRSRGRTRNRIQDKFNHQRLSEDDGTSPLYTALDVRPCRALSGGEERTYKDVLCCVGESSALVVSHCQGMMRIVYMLWHPGRLHISASLDSLHTDWAVSSKLIMITVSQLLSVVEGLLLVISL